MHGKTAYLTVLLATALLLAACGRQEPEAEPEAPLPDTVSPQVHITSAATSTEAAYELTGIAFDDTGIETLTYTLNGSAAHPLELEGNRFSTGLTLKPGTNSIGVTAGDAAGNEGSDSLTVTYTAAPSGLTPDTDIAVRGAVVTITGEHLGESGSLSLAGAEISATDWSTEEITFTVPEDAPHGPQQLLVQAGTVTELFDLFIGFDFPAGTLEQLAAENLPAGTAVRFGEGTFEGSSPEIILDNLSLYGRGTGKTTIRSEAADPDDPNPPLLLLYADAEQLTVRDLRLESAFTLIIPTPPEPPVFPAAALLPEAAGNAPELRAAPTPDLGTASVDGRLELSNVHISSVHNSFAGFGTGDYGDVAYTGDVILDGVEIAFGGDLTGIGLTGRSIRVEDSSLGAAGMMIISNSGISLSGSSLLAEDFIEVQASQTLDITDGSHLETARGAMRLGAEMLPGRSTITGSTFRAANPHPNVAINEAGGDISLTFQPAGSVVEGNTFTAERDIYITVKDGTGITFRDNTFMAGLENGPTGFGSEVLVDGRANSFTQFQENTFTWLNDPGPRFRLNGQFLFTDNEVNGPGSGTAFSAARHSDQRGLALTATGNTFTDFARALQLDGNGTDAPAGGMNIRIRDNVFAFPIDQPGATALLRDMTSANTQLLDASRNVWGENTDAAAVSSFITLENGSEPGLMVIDPLRLP